MSNSLSLGDLILVALRRITRAIDLRSRTLLQDYGLTSPQLATLKVIARLQPANAGTIAKAVHLGQPTITGILDRLARRGLIERIRSEADRRSVHISLTEPGRRGLENAPSLLQEHFQQKLSKLPEWERTQILATLQRIADMMDATELNAAPGFDREDLADSTFERVPLDVDEEDSSVADIDLGRPV